jgi:hypothetical protein
MSIERRRQQEGRTIAIEYRWGEGRDERFAEVAALMTNSVMSPTAICLSISMETGFSPHRELQCARGF